MYLCIKENKAEFEYQRKLFISADSANDNLKQSILKASNKT